MCLLASWPSVYSGDTHKWWPCSSDSAFRLTWQGEAQRYQDYKFHAILALGSTLPWTRSGTCMYNMFMKH